MYIYAHLSVDVSATKCQLSAEPTTYEQNGIVGATGSALKQTLTYGEGLNKHTLENKLDSKR